MEEERTISSEIKDAFEKYSSSVYERRHIRNRKHRKRPTKRQAGTFPPSAASGFVYVAAGTEGWIKIGVTADLEHRARAIGARIVWWKPVTRAASLHIEAEVLRLLGRDLGTPGEWVRCPASTAIKAATEAVARVACFMHVDPNISEENARHARISLAIGKKI